MKHDLDSYPTICGFCGKALVEDKDGMMNCDCPKFTEMVKSGLTENPEAYKGWKTVPCKFEYKGCCMALACYSPKRCGGRDKYGNPAYEVTGSKLYNEWKKFTDTKHEIKNAICKWCRGEL